MGCGDTYVSNMADETLSSPTGVNISIVLTKIYVISFFIHWTARGWWTCIAPSTSNIYSIKVTLLSTKMGHLLNKLILPIIDHSHFDHANYTHVSSRICVQLLRHQFRELRKSLGKFKVSSLWSHWCIVSWPAHQRVRSLEGNRHSF